MEAPSFRIPTLNIGDRQLGRLKADSVIDSPVNFDSICSGIDSLLNPSDQFRSLVDNTINPYGSGLASRLIFDLIQTLPLDKGSSKSPFYDIDFNLGL